jgi:hypothetical protein
MKLIGLLLAGVIGTGCYATTSGGVYTPAYVGPSVSVTATTVGPDLVTVSPGVQVIADYDEPVFFTGGFYWREVGGVWYRSSYHTGGWVTYSAPTAIVSIRDRHSYRRYRPAGWAPRNRAYTRDNRTYRPNNRPAYRNDNRPAVRRDYNDNRPQARPARNNDNNRPSRKYNDDDRKKSRR